MSALRDHSILLHIIRYCDQIERAMVIMEEIESEDEN